MKTVLNLCRTLLNSPAKKTKIYRDDVELLFLETQLRFYVAIAEFFFCVQYTIVQPCIIGTDHIYTISNMQHSISEHNSIRNSR